VPFREVAVVDGDGLLVAADAVEVSTLPGRAQAAPSATTSWKRS
jgi:hypothetical protein